MSRDAGDTWTSLRLTGVRDRGAITDVMADPSVEGAGFIGTSSGNLYYGRLADERWSRIMFGMPAIQSVLAT
jgi:hypothetical protein